MPASPVSHRKEITAAIGVLAVVILLVVAVSLQARPASQVATTTTMQASQPDTTKYTDGTYSAEGKYSSPGGQEAITIQVTLQNNVVTDTSAQPGGNDQTAKAYQSQFIGGYKQQVVGKPIGNLSLSRVSGSSLTSQGFNDAIKQIKNQAKA